jgi:phage shock protein A
MSILKRVKDITAATLHDTLDKIEDPVKLINQYLEAQKEQIEKTEKLYVQMNAHTKNLQQQYLTAEQVVKKREEQALMAVKAGEEQLARMALQEKLVQEEKATRFKELYEQGKASTDQLAEQLASLKGDFQEALSKRHFYQARLQTISLRKKMNESMGQQLGHTPGSRLFDRLEEKVADFERETDALGEVRRMGQELVHAGATVQQTLEKELQGLKNRLEREGWLKR